MSDINQENSNFDEQNGDSLPETGKKKLTDTQLRVVQFIAGIISAAALVVSMFVPSELVRKGVLAQNDLLSYLFVVVFLVVMFGRRTIENKYRLRLGLFSLTLIDGIMAGILIWLIKMFFFDSANPIALADIFKVLIIVGVVLIILIPGILIPFLRYRKRVENDTLPPIRIPKKKEDEVSEKTPEQNDGPLSIEQKIAAMMADMDNQGESKQDDGENPEEK